MSALVITANIWQLYGSVAVAFQQAAFQAERAVHARLLGRGEESLDGTVLDRVVLQHGQNGRHAYAVIGA